MTKLKYPTLSRAMHAAGSFGGDVTIHRDGYEVARREYILGMICWSVTDEDEMDITNGGFTIVCDDI